MVDKIWLYNLSLPRLSSKAVPRQGSQCAITHLCVYARHNDPDNGFVAIWYFPLEGSEIVFMLL